MPVLHSVIHKIDKKPDGSPAVLFLGNAEQIESQARDDLMYQLNESYNSTVGKAWGLFNPESGAYPLSGWLGKYLVGVTDFLSFSVTAVGNQGSAVSVPRYSPEGGLGDRGHQSRQPTSGALQRGDHEAGLSPSRRGGFSDQINA